jgi:hypothetical protein
VSARLRLALLALALAAVPSPARAAGPYDPEVGYRTLSSPHFAVVFPEGYEHIALRAARIAESALPGMVERYGHRPDGRITIVIDDQTDFANGSATILPNKLITLFVTAPTEISGLEDYDDWLQMVVVHELAHVIHLDMAWGLPWLGRLLLGKYVALNQYTAAWATEGLAVYEETAASGAGRGRSSLVEMVLRTAALEDRFPGVDQGFRAFSQWPFSNVAYFFGGRFQQWLAERFGEPALMHYHRAYASTPIPYLTWLSSHLAFGASIESLWARFELETRADAELERRLLAADPMGLTEPTRLTRFGGQVLGPQVTPDGRSILFSTSSPVDGPRIRRMPIDGGEDEVLLEDTLSKALSFGPGGRAFYFQQTEINQRFYFHNSVLRYDLERDVFERVRVDPSVEIDYAASSGSLRIRDPDVSPDGRRIVFVQTPFGANRLILGWLESDGVTVQPRVLVPAEPDVELSNPRFSPSGDRIAVSRFARGRRDVVVYDLEGQLVRRVTDDRAQDIDPTWSPDGRWLVFASDRSGIYNLYAYEWATDRLVRLTNVLTGAFQPCVAPDGRRLVFRGYTADGYDVFALPFAPETGLEVPTERAPMAALDASVRRSPAARDEVRLPPPPPAPFTGTPLEALPEGWSLGPYSALPTLLPFHDNWNLFPLLATNERELFAQLTHFGRDALGTHSYTLWLTYGSGTQFLGGGAAYSNDQLLPTFTIAGEASARSFALFGEEGFAGWFDERRIIGRFGISVPLYQRHQLSVSYTFEDRRALRDPEPILAARFRFPSLGHYARVQLGYAYANVRSFAHSISLERGWSAALALDGLSTGLGSDYEQLVLSGELRGYLSLPWSPRWAKNHVLAGRLALAAGAGPDLAERFRVGGATGQSALTTTTQNFFPLRGLRTSALSGTGALSGSLEYRAPLLRLDRGLGTAPVTLRVLHAAAFVDLGRVWERLELELLGAEGWRDLAVGAGLELRADILLGWALPLELRAGWAQRVLSPDPALDASGPYFQIGSTF